MKTWKTVTADMAETHALGRKIGEAAAGNTVILLDGDLGAGKTTLTQGIAMGLGVKKNVTSPTFTILKIYHGRLTLNHIDAYRLEGASQDLGFDELLEDDGVTVIEWPGFAGELIPDEYLKISIHLLENDNREFIFEACGKQYEALLEEIA